MRILAGIFAKFGSGLGEPASGPIYNGPSTGYRHVWLAKFVETLFQ